MDEVDGLISVLLDYTARIDERDDAAMDLGEYNGDKVLDILTRVASNPSDNQVVLDSCGRSIGVILVKRDTMRPDILALLAPISKSTAIEYMKYYKPQWFQDNTESISE